MKISIIGAGWVGLPLTQLLISQGHQLQVSKSSQQGLSQLLQHGIDAKKIQLVRGAVADSDIANLTQFGQADVVVITIPPGFRSGDGDFYPANIRAICQGISADVKQVILTSSTAVYPEIDQDMDETDAQAWNDKAAKILQAEQIVQTSFAGKSLIVRFSGLFGCSRDPARFVKHMQTVSNRSYANMLHQTDAVQGVAFLINNGIVNEVVNLSSPSKISKAQFYQAALSKSSNTQEKLQLPQVSEQGHKKYIKVDKIKAIGYSFSYNNAIDAL